MEASISSWINKLDASIWVTYYGFACHLQVIVDLNRESCILEHITWRFQIPNGVLPITLVQHGLYACMNPCDYESTLWGGLNWRLCLTDDLPAPSCERSKLVTFCPAAVTSVCNYFHKESGQHVEWVLYGSCVWNRIGRLYHRDAVAWYWQILTGIHLYCTVSNSFLFSALVCWFLVIQFKKILNSNGSYSIYNF